jgi:hypothetical protein
MLITSVQCPKRTLLSVNQSVLVSCLMLNFSLVGRAFFPWMHKFYLRSDLYPIYMLVSCLFGILGVMTYDESLL